MSTELVAWLGGLRPPVLFTTMSDWAVYFPMGLVLTLQARSLKPVLVRYQWLLLGTTASLFGLGLSDAFGWIATPWARFLAPVPLMFLLPVVRRQVLPLVGHLEAVGKRSYGIYLAHFVIINLSVAVIVRFSERVDFVPLVTYPLLLVGVFGLTLMLIEAMTISVPTRRIHRYVFG